LYVTRRLTEVGVVEDVEGVRTQCESKTLKDLGLLLSREIDVRESRASTPVTLDVADTGVDDG
jgi:hypothetical protein